MNGELFEQLFHLRSVDDIAAAIVRVGDVNFCQHRRIGDGPGVGRVLREQRRGCRSAAGARLVVKALALLVEPDVAGHHAENQTAALLRVAVIRGGVNVEPDAVHMREVAAEFADHLVAFALGAEAGAFHDAKVFELGAMLQDHFEIGIETAGGDDDGFTEDVDGFVTFGSGETGRRGHLCVISLPAVVDVMIVMLGIDAAVLISAVMRPKPLLSGRCQRSTRLPS